MYTMRNNYSLFHPLGYDTLHGKYLCTGHFTWLGTVRIGTCYVNVMDMQQVLILKHERGCVSDCVIINTVYLKKSQSETIVNRKIITGSVNFEPETKTSNAKIT